MVAMATKTIQDPPSYTTLAEDRSSAEGKFGWAPFGNKFVPYIYRSSEKFVSVKMMRHHVFDAYLKFFTNDLYQCFETYISKMTAVEANLLNEINYIHSDNLFGRMILTYNDDLISLDDATSVYTFLQFCYEKLVLKSENGLKMCGFVKINSENFIPYVWHNYKRYVPLFYFDGEYKYLEERAEKLNSWPLTYLRLCCKIHGVRKTFYAEESMSVVDLEVVKKFFPPDTSFDDSWPQENKVDCLIHQENVERERKAQAKVRPTSTAFHKNPTPQNVGQKSHDLGPSDNIHQPMVAIPNTAPALDMQLLSEIHDDRLGFRLFQIKDLAFLNNSSYFLLNVRFGSKFLDYCVNLSPNDTTTMLVAMEEVVKVTQIPLELFVKAIHCLKIDVFLPNTHQRALLKSVNVNRTLGLLKVSDLINSMNSIRNTCCSLSLKR